MIFLKTLFFLLLPFNQPTELTFDQDQRTLPEIANRYCIAPDGDHRLTWQLAEEDGFSWLNHTHFPNLRIRTTPNVNLRGLEKSIDGITYRVLTTAYSHTSRDDGHSFFRQCWVSASAYDINDAEQELNNMLGVRRFRSQRTLIYAWIPQIDGSRRTVIRRVYMRKNLTLAREQGLRQVTLARYGTASFIGYRSPRDEATYRLFDWAGPEPVASPE